MDEADAQARMCGRLFALVMDLPREEFGDQYRLAVDAAYSKVQALLMSELERVARGTVVL